jgi:hypothetical protein
MDVCACFIILTLRRGFLQSSTQAKSIRPLTPKKIYKHRYHLSLIHHIQVHFQSQEQ